MREPGANRAEMIYIKRQINGLNLQSLHHTYNRKFTENINLNFVNNKKTLFSIRNVVL